MKVAVFHELPFGGARDATYQFSSELNKSNFKIDLYYVSESKEEKDLSFFNKIKFYQISEKKWSGNNWKIRLYNDTFFLFQLSRLHKKIAKKIDSQKYDLIFVHGSKYIEAPFILRYLKTKKVFYCHDPNYRIAYEKILKPKYLKTNIFKYIYEVVNRYFRKNLDKKNFMAINYVIANSKFAQKIIYKTYGKKSTILYPGVDTHFFNTLENSKKDIDIFYIGSRSKIDGYSLLIDAKRLLPKKTKIVTKMYEDGWIDANLIRDYYRRSKLVVCLAHNEPFGSVPIEAFACGVPVIAVNEGGHLETVENNINGILIKRNSRELAKAIKYLLNNNKVRLQLGKNARKIAIEKWDWSRTGNMLTEYFKSIK